MAKQIDRKEMPQENVHKQHRNPYQNYEDWKGWDETFVYSAEDAKYNVGETRGMKVAGGDLLEIGYGSGRFLAWAKEQGAQVSGTEIIPALIDAGEKFGLKILLPDFETTAFDHEACFDTIVAFDVFEHFTLDEIITRLGAIETMLRPGGHVLLRFPNGQSPFGLPTQNGDSTHKTALSRTIFVPLIHSLDLEVVHYRSAFRITGGGLVRRLVRRLRYIGRDIISGTLNFIYAQNIPWDPVVVLVLRKQQDK